MGNIKIEFNQDAQLKKLLKSYFDSSEAIKLYIKTNGLKRFSHKKFVGDLGEFYFHKYCKHLFKPGSLVQSATATHPYDFDGKFINCNKFKNYCNKNIRIEIKTRFGQVGSPYISGVHLEKFDFLAFIFLNDDYSCRYIAMIEKDKLVGKLDEERKRLVFREGDFDILLASGEFVKIKQWKNP